MNRGDKIIELRRILADRFPQAVRTRSFRPVHSSPSLIDIPPGALTEIAAFPCGAGTGLALHQMLERSIRRRAWIALVDGADAFDPSECATPAPRFLWVRCRHALEALQSAELLLQDGNIPRVLLDLRFNPDQELKKLHAALWHRLQRMAEHSGTALALFTPRPLAGSARLRITFAKQFDGSAFDRDREELEQEIQGAITLRRANGALAAREEAG